MDTRYFQSKLKSEGITEDQLDMSKFEGCTLDELIAIMNHAIAWVQKQTDPGDLF